MSHHTRPALHPSPLRVSATAALAALLVRLATAVAAPAGAATLKPTSLSGWPAATTQVAYLQTASRTITTQPGRVVHLQRLDGTAWTKVSGLTVPASGSVRVTLPAVTSGRTLTYRVRVTTSTTHAAVSSAAWTIVPIAPAMPAQRYNGEIRGVVGAWAGFTNGTIPLSVLCTPAWTAAHHEFRCDAAAALTEMNAAYKAKFGTNLVVTSSYRTYAQQVTLKEAKPTLAATPGTSNHGWGLAVDLGGGVQTFGTAQHNWMRANANRYGWFAPAWAQFNGSLPEAWHWEYAGAVASGRTDQSRALATQLARTEPWNSKTQRQCLADLWQATSGWDFRATADKGVRRGIPLAHMPTAFGTGWATSSTATAYLQIPQRQIEWGLKDITARYGTACRAKTALGR